MEVTALPLLKLSGASPDVYEEKFEVVNDIKKLGILQQELSLAVSRVKSLLRKRNEITVFHDPPTLTSIEKTTIANIIDNFVETEETKDLFLTGSAVVQGPMVIDTLIVNSTTDNAALVRGGMTIDKTLKVKNGISAENKGITNVASPVQGTDAVNKDYVDYYLGQRSPFILYKAVPMTTTLQDYVTYASYVIPESGIYRTHISITYASHNTLSIRVVIGGQVVKEITVHPSPKAVLSWTELFNGLHVPSTNTLVEVQCKSEFGSYPSTLYSAFIEFVSWRHIANVFFTSKNTVMTTTSTVPVVFHQWVTPVLSVGTWRFRLSYTYSADNTIRAQCHVDNVLVVDFQDDLKPYEKKVNEMVRDIVVSAPAVKTILLTLSSPRGFSSHIHSCYMEFTKLAG